MAKTVLGAAGDDDQAPLTPEQREALRRALSNPAFGASIQRATDALEIFNRQIAAGLVTSIAPALDRWREQQREIAQSIAPVIAQAQIKNVLAPLAEQIGRFQQDIAAQLRVAVVANAEVQSRMATLVAGSEFQEALRRIGDIAAVRLSVPTDDGLTRISDLIETGEIDQETLEEAEQGVSGDVQLSEAVEAAAEALSKSRPLLSRTRARQIVVFWVWLMYGGALWAVAVLTNPGVAAVPGALGLPSAPAVAKAVGNRVVPPKEEDEEGEEKK